jgi:hypothetical protein
MTTQIRKEQLEFSQSDGAIKIPVTTQDKDFEVTVNDGGTTRTAIQVHGDEGSVSFPRQSYVVLNKTSNQTISTGTTTIITWQNIGDDTLGEMDSNVFTAKTAGVYNASINIYWDSLTTNDAALQLFITGPNFSYVHYDAGIYANRSRKAQSVSGNFKLAVGETITFRVWQNTGVNQQLGSQASWTRATITKVS